VRKEQKEMSQAYYQHIQNVLWVTKDDSNIIPYVFGEHKHQIGMLRDVLPAVKTPLLLYVEQDAPLTPDRPIEWDKLRNDILSGTSNLIRFHFEDRIPKDHNYLMIGKPENGLLKTVQWSQRPHLASTAFYNHVVQDYFTTVAKCFIEDRMHGRVIDDFNKFGEQGWNLWRMHIYYPQENNIKRSYTTNGRAEGAKYDDSQIW
jgi:hypothetical protein